MINTHCLYHITSRCNLRCSHCYNNYSDSYTKNQELNLSEKIELLKKLSVFFDTLIIAGGDLFQLPERYTIIEVAKKLFKNISIQTNATIIENEIGLEQFRVPITVSLEGNIEENDSIRGNGVYEQALKNLVKMKQMGIDLTIRQTIFQFNSPDHLLKISEYLDTNYVALRYLGKNKNFAPNKQKIKEFYLKINKAAQKRINKTIIAFEPPFYILNTRLLQKYKDIFKERRHICESTYKISVNADGNAYFCQAIQKRLGNFLKDAPEKIFKKMEEINKRIISRELIQSCKECPYVNTCAGGCLYYSYDSGYYHKKIRGDPFCPIPELFSDNLKETVLHEEPEENELEEIKKYLPMLSQKQ